MEIEPWTMAGEYDAGGNIVHKAAGGPDVYDPAHPHAVGSADGVTLIRPGDAEDLHRAIVGQSRQRARTTTPGSAVGAWTWTDVVRRILSEAEQVRRSQWHWDPPGLAGGPATNGNPTHPRDEHAPNRGEIRR